MAVIKISALPAADAPVLGTDLVALVQSPDGLSTRRATVNAVLGPAVLTIAFPGEPDAGDLVTVVVPYPVRLKAGAAGSVVSARVAPTANATFSIRKVAGNAAGTGTAVGTATIDATDHDGAFTVAADVDWAAGEVLVLEAPDPEDGSMADVSMTLMLERV